MVAQLLEMRLRRSGALATMCVCVALGCREQSKPVGSGTASPSAATIASAAAGASAADAAGVGATRPDERYAGIAPIVLPLGYDTPKLRAKKLSSIPDPHWPADAKVTLDDSFVFQLGMGDGRDGLNVTTLARDGRARHEYFDEKSRAYRGVEFRASPDEIRRLVELLNGAGFLQQPMRVEAVGVHDGAQWIFLLRTAGRDKYVSLSNAFPEPLRGIASYVTKGLIDQRPELRGESRSHGGVGNGIHDRHLWRGSHDYVGLEDDRPYVVQGRFACEKCPKRGRLEARVFDSGTKTPLSSRTWTTDPNGETYFFVEYDPKKVDSLHDYQLELSFTAAGKRWRSAAQPVLTKGHPHAREVELLAVSHPTK